MSNRDPCLLYPPRMDWIEALADEKYHHQHQDQGQPPPSSAFHPSRSTVGLWQGGPGDTLNHLLEIWTQIWILGPKIDFLFCAPSGPLFGFIPHTPELMPNKISYDGLLANGGII